MAVSTDHHIVIINRNYPPRTGVTGESACVLARWLTEKLNCQISIVTVRSNYAGGGSKLEPVGQIHEIASWYDGKNKLLRLGSTFIECFLLVWKARRLRADSTIVMTDPSFLSAWASVLLGKKRRWGLWSMDLFPEAFVAGKLVTDRNLFFRFLSWLVYRTPPKFLIALGELQAKYLSDSYGCEIPTAILPCGVFDGASVGAIPDWKTDSSERIVIGYCGNLGEAHSVEFLHSVIRNLDPEKFQLVLKVYGAKSEMFLEQLGECPDGVSLIGSVSRSQLGFIDIHLVSLLGQWANVCVPSKAISAVCSGSSFLFYGIEQCDNWQMLQNAGWLVPETDNIDKMDEIVDEILQSITHDLLNKKREAARAIARTLLADEARAFAQIGQLLPPQS